MDVIENIVERTLMEVEQRKERIPAEHFNLSSKSLSLYDAILNKKKEGTPVISEIKPGSPSLGRIADIDVESAAKAMESAGACAISVLTEPHYFFGSLENLKKAKEAVEIPILRKDFIVNEYQIKESKHYGADAILLMVSVLGKRTKEFLNQTEKLGMEAIVEVHDESELKIALNAGAKIVGINNRNLKNLKVNLETTKKLAPMIGEGKIVVSESGIKSKEDLRFVLDSGADAALIGTTLMQAKNIEEKIKEFLSA